MLFLYIHLNSNFENAIHPNNLNKESFFGKSIYFKNNILLCSLNDENYIYYLFKFINNQWVENKIYLPTNYKRSEFNLTMNDEFIFINSNSNYKGENLILNII